MQKNDMSWTIQPEPFSDYKNVVLEKEYVPHQTYPSKDPSGLNFRDGKMTATREF